MLVSAKVHRVRLVGDLHRDWVGVEVDEGRVAVFRQILLVAAPLLVTVSATDHFRYGLVRPDCLPDCLINRPLFLRRWFFSMFSHFRSSCGWLPHRSSVANRAG